RAALDRRDGRPAVGVEAHRNVLRWVSARTASVPARRRTFRAAYPRRRRTERESGSADRVRLDERTQVVDRPNSHRPNRLRPPRPEPTAAAAGLEGGAVREQDEDVLPGPGVAADRMRRIAVDAPDIERRAHS